MQTLHVSGGDSQGKRQLCTEHTASATSHNCCNGYLFLKNYLRLTCGSIIFSTN